MARDPADPRAALDPAGLSGLDIASATSRLAAAFARAGIADGARDARILIAATLGIAPARLLIEPERTLSDADASRLAAFANRRCGREPVSRILGWREFYGRRFAITRATLDPRPDSETLIDTALGIVRARGWTSKPLTILDIGTGSGCLLATLLAELPRAHGVGVDIDPAAITVARANAATLGISCRARWIRGDGAAALSGPFDLIVANPPYIARAVIESLDAEVRDFDPPAALDGGADGLAFYRAWGRELPRLANRGSAILFEIGHDQAEAVSAILSTTLAPGAPHHVRVAPDLGTRPRCVVIEAQRSSCR